MNQNKQPKALTQAELRNKLGYDPDTGLFRWRNVSKYHSEKRNQIAGCVTSWKGKKYISIRINRRREPYIIAQQGDKYERNNRKSRPVE